MSSRRFDSKLAVMNSRCAFRNIRCCGPSKVLGTVLSQVEFAEVAVSNCGQNTGHRRGHGIVYTIRKYLVSCILWLILKRTLNRT